MAYCRKCGVKIPCKKRINGKIVNLCNRRFCLECSPFGSRNTKPDDPSRPSKRDRKKPYGMWPEEMKLKHLKGMRDRQRILKRKIVLLFGGRCSVCGYDRCLNALEFHHRSHDNKKFELNAREVSKHSWESVVEEAKKCDLLCSNCHKERHNLDTVNWKLLNGEENICDDLVG